MKIKRKPEKPVRGRVPIERISFHLTYEELSKWIEENDVENVIFSVKYDTSSKEHYLRVGGNALESEQSFLKKIDDYNRKMEEYLIWYEKNKDEVNNILKTKAEEQKKKLKEKIKLSEESLRKDKVKLKNLEKNGNFVYSIENDIELFKKESRQGSTKRKIEI